MVSGQRCRVAYKAVAHTGLGVDMMAKVMDDQGTVVAENSATHCGMGIFYLTPQPGRSYHVVCTSRDVPSYFVLDGSVWNGDEIYEWNAYCRIRKSKGGLSEEEQGIANRLEEDHRAMTAIMESVRLRDVQQIDIIKDPMAGTLSGIVRTTNNTGMDLSAIAITTRNGSGEVGKNTRLVKPMGYQKPVDFYNPRYEVPNNYTLRHTVYWNPSLRIKDGKATFDFLPNGAKIYRISVEGIGTEGQMVCISK